MATQGRSLDDLPLAAYSTGMKPEARLEAPAPTDEAAPTDEPAPATDHAREPAAPMFSAAAPPAHELAADPEGLAAPARQPTAAEWPAPAVMVAGLVRRNPRVAAGAGFVAVILVGLLLLTAGGQAPPSLAASASPTVPPIAVILPPTGDASLVLTGAVQGTYTFSGGARDAAKSGSFTATWTDATQDALGLDAKVDRGTRTTDLTLVLRLTVLVNGVAVTFTSENGECTVGMGVQPTTVSGSFTCKKLKSEDGKLTIGATGTYRT